jgi:hypothetical protein
VLHAPPRSRASAAIDLKVRPTDHIPLTVVITIN